MKSSPLRRTVDGYYCELEDVPLRLDFLRLRQATGGVHSGVWTDVVASTKGMSGWRDFHESRYNVSSASTRRELAKLLSARVVVPSATPEDWLNLVDSVCSAVCRAARQGKEPVCLAERQDPGPPAYLVGSILEQNQLTILYGDKSSGKSHFALAVAYAVHEGIDTLLGVAVQRQPVLYLDWETDEDEQTRRLYRIARGLQVQHIPSIEYIGMDRPLLDDANALRKRAEGHLVVIDSLVPACGGDAREEAATGFWHAVRAMDTTVLTIAQTQKRQPGEKRVRSVFGSAMFEYAARSIWLVRAYQERGASDLHLALVHEKCNNGPLEEPHGWRVDFEEDSTRFERENPKAVPEFTDIMTVADQIAEVLRYGERKVCDIAAELQRSEATIRKLLHRHAGRFVRRGDKWGLLYEETA